MAVNHHVYTNAEMADMHLMYGLAGCNSREAQRLYQQHFPNRVIPHYQTFISLHARLQETGSFLPRKNKPGRPRSVRTIQLEENVLEEISNHPEKSTRELGVQFRTSKDTIWNILKEQQLHPYHVQKVQALLPEDYPRRVEFCQTLVEKCENDNNFVKNILFTDEAKFSRAGIVNLHNTHIWADENPHAIVRFRHQHEFSLNVWAGILGDHLVFSFLPQILNGERYLYFLRTELPVLLEDIPLEQRLNSWFMMDGAPSHFRADVRDHVATVYEENWIGRGGPVPWPARSPDLNPIDFFLWGHLKSIVYASPVQSVEELRDRIVNGFNTIRQTPGIFQRVRESMRRRLDACVANEGRNFEQLL